MAYSEQTAHYGLPHWLGDDKPTFLVDLNGAFSDIDTAIYEARLEGTQGQQDAQTVDNKVTAITNRVETLESDNLINKANISSIESTVSGQGGAINTINSLIGNGEPTTQDKTIIGAINELAGEIPSGTLGTEDIADNLTTNDATKVLSAKQGVEIKGLIDGVAGGVESMVKVYANKAVAVADFVSDATYNDYGYKAEVACVGVTANHVPFVNFGMDEAVSDNYAPIALAGTDKVTIYAKAVPASAITIPSIVCVKEA